MEEKENVILPTKYGILVSQKKNNNLSFVTNWLKQDDIVFSEIIQTQNRNFHMSSLTCLSKEQ